MHIGIIAVGINMHKAIDEGELLVIIDSAWCNNKKTP